MRHILIAAITLWVMMFSNAFAHDAWVEKRDGEFVVLYGHGEMHDPYDPARVKEVKGFDIKGNAVPVEIIKKKDGASLSPKGEVAMITLVFDNGYWVKTTDGWKNISKREAKEYIESIHSIKYGKTYLAWSDAFAKPVGMRLEIIPLTDPLSAKVGYKNFQIKVLYEGKPLEGAKIGTGGHTIDKTTDKDGIATIGIFRKGINVISARHRVPLKDNPDADMISLGTVITFEVK